MSSEPIRIVLAEDHALVRAGIRLLLERAPDLTVVGEVANGLDAVRLAEEARPDVMLMDLSLPDLNGIDATAEITRRVPATRVLVVSMHSEAEYVARALTAGAAGYVVKESGGEELTAAVRAVAAGEQYVSEGLEETAATASDHGDFLYDRLTPRQKEVCQLVAEGNTTREIAVRLGISAKTVEAHRAEIMRRLEVPDLASLVRLTVRLGVIPA